MLTISGWNVGWNEICTASIFQFWAQIILHAPKMFIQCRHWYMSIYYSLMQYNFFTCGYCIFKCKVDIIIIDWNLVILYMYMCVSTSQGKQGKWWKVIPDIENTENLNILEKYREFENLNREIQYQEDNSRKIYCLTLMKWRFNWGLKCCHFFIRKFTGKTKIAQGKNMGNLVFNDEWEPCGDFICLTHLYPF